MNKKVYIQPQVWTISTYAECSAPLITGSTRTEDYTGGDEDGIQNGGTEMIWAPRSTLTTLTPGIPGIKNYQ